MIVFPFPAVGRLLDRLPAVSFTADRHELWVGARWRRRDQVLRLHPLPGLGIELDFDWSARAFEDAFLKYMSRHMAVDLDSLAVGLPLEPPFEGERGFISFGPPA